MTTPGPTGARREGVAVAAPHPSDDSDAKAAPPSRMWQWTTLGDGVEKLQRDTVDVPRPGPTEVLVRIGGWSLNYRDLLVVNGVEGWRPRGPVVPISDAAGTVVAAGPSVTRYGLGDRVSASFLPSWRSGPLTAAALARPTGGPVNRGTLGEFMVIEEGEAVRVPHRLDLVQAATLPIAAVTAWHAVVRRSRVAAGETVLVHGTGGVSLFAVQFSLALGARPIVTSSSDDKLRRLQGRWPVRVVNYRRTSSLADAVRGLNGGREADHVVETVGGAHLNDSLAAVRLGGTIAFVGLLAGLDGRVNTYEFVTRNVTLHGIETGSHDMYREMAAFIDDHRISPVIDTAFPVSAAREALQHLSGGAHLGKIVLHPDDELPGASAHQLRR